MFSSVKAVLDKTDAPSHYIFSGSQKWRLMEGPSDALVGQTSIFELENLSMREIFGIDNKSPFLPRPSYLENTGKTIKNYGNVYDFILRGFYPRLYEDRSYPSARYYENYVNTYLEKDVYDIKKIEDSIAFRNFLSRLASTTGQMLSYENVARDVGVDVRTIKSWVSILEKTNIITLLHPYASSRLKRTIKTPKVYFKDTGLACFLAGWPYKEALFNGAFAGPIFETFVVNEIIKSFSNAGLNHEGHLFYYRAKDKLMENGQRKEAEIDLLIDYGHALYPIEIKKTAKPKAEMASSFKALDKILDHERGLGTIVCLVDDVVYLRDNLVALPVEYL